MRRIDTIFVHCTATPQSWTIQDLERVFKDKGWKTAGYHIAITADGVKHKMVQFENISNGVKGHNANSINVAYFGGLEGKDNRTEAQKKSLLEVLKYLRELFPNAEIKGHRDIWGKCPWEWKKLCPCFDAEKEYQNI